MANGIGKFCANLLCTLSENTSWVKKAGRSPLEILWHRWTLCDRAWTREYSLWNSHVVRYSKVTLVFKDNFWISGSFLCFVSPSRKWGECPQTTFEDSIPSWSARPGSYWRWPLATRFKLVYTGISYIWGVRLVICLRRLWSPKTAPVGWA